MNRSLVVLLLRLILGALGGWFLAHFFFPNSSPWLAVILGAIVVVAAYASEAWRLMRQKK
ncbi:hypothetical protein [Dethiosulfatarculus sandiegensis]|uniref:Uncharacterized protein n=1 Tax=Dethiosulfatarculus sandiegensis TaxID=1429043 RepID=A0A0D2JK85_9BACT|nr:hypothetical protein [Dethiosulfatarculus sandiegensis]KIX16031.1 hypothetical protein X474_00335 [Dethiosulfatarculus sandiegensis]